MTQDVHAETVKCTRCRRNLDLSCFYRDRSKVSGRKSHCRACSKTACQQWKKANPEKVAKQVASQRRRDRLLREPAGASRPLSPRSEQDARTYRAIIETFGDDFHQFGIRLEGASNLPSEHNPIWTLHQALHDLEDVTDYGFKDKFEMFLTGVFIYNLSLTNLLSFQRSRNST